MAHFLLQASYTPEALQAMLQKPQDRTAAVRAPIETLGGKLHNLFLAFGDYDVVAVVEMPDSVAAAAIALAISAGGACKNVKTTHLLTVTEAMEAARKAAASGYHALASSRAAS